MQLKDFIKTTLRELSEAINESSNELSKEIALTNTMLAANQMGDHGLVDFDLAVEVSESERKDNSGGLKVAIVQAKLGKDTEIASSSTSRIKFTVKADFEGEA